MSRFNDRVIEEYRATGGEVTGPFAGTPLLLMTSTGARTGSPRTNPLAYFDHGGELYVFGAHRGAPKHPDWYHNIVAEPRVTVELGTESFGAVARVLDGEERAAVWRVQIAAAPIFEEYARKAGREIPVVRLEREGQGM
jgi:deazaflavin-dependent oxidoreductase (nitroreductase family)